MKILGSAAAAAVVTLAGAAQAQMLNKITPDDVVGPLSNAGAYASVGTDSVTGGPMVQIENPQDFGANQMLVFFFSCASDSCEDIMMWAWFPGAGPSALEQANAYSMDNRWSRAYIDQDGDPVLEADINATGGIGQDALGILLRTYLNSATDFAAFMATPPAPAAPVEVAPPPPPSPTK